MHTTNLPIKDLVEIFGQVKVHHDYAKACIRSGHWWTPDFGVDFGYYIFGRKGYVKLDLLGVDHFLSIHTFLLVLHRLPKIDKPTKSFFIWGLIKTLLDKDPSPTWWWLYTKDGFKMVTPAVVRENGCPYYAPDFQVEIQINNLGFVTIPTQTFKIEVVDYQLINYIVNSNDALKEPNYNATLRSRLKRAIWYFCN